MAKAKVIPLFDRQQHDFEQLLSAVRNGPGKIMPANMIIEFNAERALMLAYKAGDRCLRCGNGAFNVGRTVATCANPRCELPVPLG